MLSLSHSSEEVRTVHRNLLGSVGVIASTAVVVQQTGHSNLLRSHGVHDRVSQTNLLNLLIAESSIVRSDGCILLTSVDSHLCSKYSYETIHTDVLNLLLVVHLQVHLQHTILSEPALTLALVNRDTASGSTGSVYILLIVRKDSYAISLHLRQVSVRRIHVILSHEVQHLECLK